MIKPKKPEEIARLREGGRRLAHILNVVQAACEPGMALLDLDAIAAQEAEKVGGQAAFFKYQPTGAPRPYPAHICVSVNDEIVHGIPTETERKLIDGDLISLDMGLIWEDLVTDSATTFVVGDPSSEQNALMKATQDALAAGISRADPEARVGDISAAIQDSVQKSVEGSQYGGFSIFKELVGHGVGYKVHEDPHVPNVGRAGTGAKLPVGTVLAIEPMLGMGGSGITRAEDGYTYKTADGSLSAHFEHTVAVTADGPLVLTAP